MKISSTDLANLLINTVLKANPDAGITPAAWAAEQAINDMFPIGNATGVELMLALSTEKAHMLRAARAMIPTNNDMCDGGCRTGGTHLIGCPAAYA